jgi:hypothetical protein
MPIKILTSKEIRRQYEELKATLRFGAYMDKHGRRCLVGLNREGRFATVVFTEGSSSYNFARDLIKVYCIPVEFVFDDPPFPL